MRPSGKSSSFQLTLLCTATAAWHCHQLVGTSRAVTSQRPAGAPSVNRAVGRSASCIDGKVDTPPTKVVQLV